MLRHIFVNLFLKIYARPPKRANDDIRANTSRNGHVAVRVADLFIRRVIFEGLTDLVECRIDCLFDLWCVRDRLPSQALSRGCSGLSGFLARAGMRTGPG